MFCLLKPNMLKEDVLLQQIVALLKNSSQERKQTITDNYKRKSVSRHYEQSFWFVSKTEYFHLKWFFI